MFRSRKQKFFAFCVRGEVLTSEGVKATRQSSNLGRSRSTSGPIICTVPTTTPWPEIPSSARPIICSGITCADRLEALQRVMEHELVHLIEMLLWEKSSCAKPRFHSISLRFFGHSENRHQLITPKEKALVKFGIKPGVQVRFRFDGIEHTGVVNRVNKRATVLVEDRHGEQYSDGKRYAKFYVPVQMLNTVD